MLRPSFPPSEFGHVGSARDFHDARVTKKNSFCAFLFPKNAIRGGGGGAIFSSSSLTLVLPLGHWEKIQPTTGPDLRLNILPFGKTHKTTIFWKISDTCHNHCTVQYTLLNNIAKKNFGLQ